MTSNTYYTNLVRQFYGRFDFRTARYDRVQFIPIHKQISNLFSTSITRTTVSRVCRIGYCPKFRSTTAHPSVQFNRFVLSDNSRIVMVLKFLFRPCPESEMKSEREKHACIITYKYTRRTRAKTDD